MPSEHVKQFHPEKISTRAPSVKRVRAAKRRTVKSRTQRNSVKNIPISRAVTIRSTGKPASVTSNGSVTVVKHSEFFSDVTGSINYSVKALPLNPGNEEVFPYLAEIAMRFEYYRFRKLQFRYEPTCPTTTAGACYLAVDYDATDLAPGSKILFMQNMNSVRCAPYDRTSMDMVKVASAAQIKRFTLDRTPPGNADVKMYNLGNALFATQGFISDGAACGELYVDYEVELTVPQGQSDTPDSAAIDILAGKTPLTLLEGAIIQQDSKRPIVDVPGSNIPALGDVTPNVFILKKEGAYSVTCELDSTVAPAAIANNLGLSGPPGSGVTVTADTLTSANVSYTVGTQTLLRCRVVFNPANAVAAFAGMVVVGSLAALAGGVCVAGHCRLRVSPLSTPEEIALLPSIV